MCNFVAGYKKKTAMAQLVINVENPSILPSLRKVLGAMEGVSILPKVRKKAKATVEEEQPCMTKAEILQGFDEACKELKLYKEGKIQLKTLEEVIDEL